MLDCTIKDVDPIGNTNVTVGNHVFLKKTSINEPMDNMFFSLNGKIDLGHWTLPMTGSTSFLFRVLVMCPPLGSQDYECPIWNEMPLSYSCFTLRSLTWIPKNSLGRYVEDMFYWLRSREWNITWHKHLWVPLIFGVNGPYMLVFSCPEPWAGRKVCCGRGEGGIGMISGAWIYPKWTCLIWFRWSEDLRKTWLVWGSILDTLWQPSQVPRKCLQVSLPKYTGFWMACQPFNYS